MLKTATSTRSICSLQNYYPCDIAKKLYKHVLNKYHGIGKDKSTSMDFLYSYMEINRDYVDFYVDNSEPYLCRKYIGILPTITDTCMPGCPPIFGTIATTGAPTIAPSPNGPFLTINSLNQMYYWNGTSWICLNCGEAVELEFFISDELAGLGGVAIGGEYRAANGNIYGLPYGTPKIREA
jgi:hypothetical protein